MIHSFSAENFYSIGDKIEVSLISKEKEPSARELYLEAPFGKKISKITFIGGANASGKTNVLRILAYLKFIIVDSMTSHSIGATDMSKCLLFGSDNAKLSAVFSIDDDMYYYDLELTMQMILSESLEKKSIVTERGTRSLVFSRIWNQSQGKYDIEVSKELGNIRALTSLSDLANANQQAGFISIFANFDSKDGILRKVFNNWSRVASNIQVFGNRETNHSMIDLSSNSLREIYGNKDLYDRVADVLKKFDIGFKGIAKKDKAGPNKDQTVYGIEHIYGENTVGFTMNYESSGTQRLVILLETIMMALSSKNSIAVIDELDAFLHPDIFDEIISLFTSTNTNPNNTQLIFSAQNYSILTKLDKQQIILTEKNKETGQTEVWRLDDISGINSRDNFYLKYLTGAYGGVPNIG